MMENFGWFAFAGEFESMGISDIRPKGSLFLSVKLPALKDGGSDVRQCFAAESVLVTECGH